MVGGESCPRTRAAVKYRPGMLVTDSLDWRFSSSLQVDLGYEIYQGYANATSNLNIWKG